MTSELRVSPQALRATATTLSTFGTEIAGINPVKTLSAAAAAGLQSGIVSPEVGAIIDSATNKLSQAWDEFSTKLKTAADKYAAADEKAAKDIEKAGDKVDDSTGSDGNGAPPESPSNPSTTDSNPAKVAEQYLNRNASDLEHSGELPMDPNVNTHVCCANFVTSVLQKSGKINWHSNRVDETAARLKKQGWKTVPASEAKPGDVAIVNGSEHVELVDSNVNGKVTLIGSNNANADGSQRVTRDSYTPVSGNQVEYLSPP